MYCKQSYECQRIDSVNISFAYFNIRLLKYCLKIFINLLQKNLLKKKKK